MCNVPRCLGCRPVVRDAAQYLPVVRRRCFWGNLPGMYEPSLGATPRHHLSDLLAPHRCAAVDIVPTLTTSSSSQKSGLCGNNLLSFISSVPLCYCYSVLFRRPLVLNVLNIVSVVSTGKQRLLPVIEDGKESALFITEMEQLFGLPESFTDGPNLSITARRRLLGKCFCVPVIQDLLAPLKDLFWVRH